MRHMKDVSYAMSLQDDFVESRITVKINQVTLTSNQRAPAGPFNIDFGKLSRAEEAKYILRKAKNLSAKLLNLCLGSTPEVQGAMVSAGERMLGIARYHDEMKEAHREAELVTIEEDKLRALEEADEAAEKMITDNVWTTASENRSDIQRQ